MRILPVADVYDALASARPYRDPIPHVECLKMLRENAVKGGLEPSIVEAFCFAPRPYLVPGSHAENDVWLAHRRRVGGRHLATA